MEEEKVKKEDDFSYLGKFRMRNRLFSPDKPLWLPVGSLRGIAFLALIGTAIYCGVGHIYLSAKMWDLILMFSSFYLGSRMNFNDNNEKKEKKDD